MFRYGGGRQLKLDRVDAVCRNPEAPRMFLFYWFNSSLQKNNSYEGLRVKSLSCESFFLQTDNFDGSLMQNIPWFKLAQVLGIKSLFQLHSWCYSRIVVVVSDLSKYSVSGAN